MPVAVGVALGAAAFFFADRAVEGIGGREGGGSAGPPLALGSLVMLVDQMIPEAKEKAGNRAGLATVLGFAVAAGLSSLS